MALGLTRRRGPRGPTTEDLVVAFVRDVVPTLPPGTLRAADYSGALHLVNAAAEARGLRVREIDGNSVYYDGRLPVGAMANNLPSLTSGRAVRACRSKDRTKRLLEAAEIPTPVWHDLARTDLERALAVLDGRRPWVLKPALGVGGRGITTGIRSRKDLTRAWEVALAGCREESTIVLEEQAVGLDVRVLVVGNRVVAAATRLPAHVVGDGVRDVATLVAAKQAVRDDMANLADMPILVDVAHLARSRRTTATVPRDGEVVLLSELANLSQGGENVDVTDLLGDDLRDLAVAAARAIPGLGVAGVDLLVRRLDSATDAVVLEVNARAGLGVHACPAYGTPRDVSGAIVDRMIELSR